MRTAIMLSFLLTAQIGWGMSGTSATAAARPLTLIPTALQELNELRVNTGTKAVLSDGTMNAVYVMKTPAPGNVYLNFHVDVASEAGSLVLQTSDIRLDGPVATTTRPPVSATTWKAHRPTPTRVSHTPMDWFIDTGSAEVRGDRLTVGSKGIVQFTIEVPRAALDNLILSVHAQRIGTVREIRERISRDQASR